MEAIGWGFGGPDTVRPLSRRGSKSSDTAVRILRRFAFDSAVKRMSAIIERIGSSSSSAASKLWYVFFARRLLGSVGACTARSLTTRPIAPCTQHCDQGRA